MRDYVIKDENDGSIVAKYRRRTEPPVHDGFVVDEVDDVTEFDIEEPVEWFP